MKAKLLLLPLGLALIAPAPLTGTPLDLEEAWFLAKGSSAALERLDRDARWLNLEREAWWRDWIPSLSLGTGLSRSQSFGETATLAEGDRWSGRLSLDLRHSWNWVHTEERLRDKLNLRSWLLDQEEVQTQLWGQLQRLFLQIAAQEAQVTLLQVNRDLSAERARLTTQQFQRGLRSDLERLTAELAAQRDLPALARAEAELEKRWITLNGLIGRSGAPRGQIVPLESLPGPPLHAPALSDNEAWKSMAEKLLSVRRAHLRWEQARNTADLNRVSRERPSLSAGAGWSTSVPGLFSGNVPEPSRLAGNLSLSLSLGWSPDPWIPGSSVLITLGRQAEESEKAQRAYEESLRQGQEQLRALFLDREVARQSLELAISQEQLQSQSYQRTQEAYDRGAASLLDLQAAQQEHLRIRQATQTERLNLNLLDLELRLLLPVPGPTE